MLPDYAEHCFGEGKMHDTAMLLGLLGGPDYNKPAEIITAAVRQLRHRPDQRHFPPLTQGEDALWGRQRPQDTSASPIKGGDTHAALHC